MQGDMAALYAVPSLCVACVMCVCRHPVCNGRQSTPRRFMRAHQPGSRSEVAHELTFCPLHLLRCLRYFSSLEGAKVSRLLTAHYDGGSPPQNLPKQLFLSCYVNQPEIHPAQGDESAPQNRTAQRRAGRTRLVCSFFSMSISHTLRR